MALAHCALIAAGLSGQVARAVVTGNPADAAANTTGLLNGTPVYGFDHVGQVANGSIVYVGNGWYLTAHHINIIGTASATTVNPATPVTMASGTYLLDTGSWLANDANTANIDLSSALGDVSGLPNLPPLALSTATPGLGTSVFLIGYGVTNAPVAPATSNPVNYWHAAGTSAPGTYTFSAQTTTYNSYDNVGGYLLNSSNVERFGQSETAGTSPTTVYNIGNGEVTALQMNFFSSPVNDYLSNSGNTTYLKTQAAISNGDSGGATTTSNRLVAINNAEGTYGGQPGGTELFGDASYSLDIATYLQSILTATKQGQWNATTGGTWSAANWAAGVVPNADGASANFLDAITVNSAVTLGGSVTLANLNFMNNNNITVSGGTIALAFTDPATSAARPATLDVWTPTSGSSGNDTISSPITIGFVSKVTLYTQSGSLTLSGGISNPGGVMIEKMGAGTVTLSGTQNHAAGTVLNINAGKMNLLSDLGAPGQTNVQVNLNSTAANALVIGSTQHLAGLNLAAGTSVQMAAIGNQTIYVGAASGGGGGLQMAGGTNAWGGTIDLTNNAMVVSYASAAGAQVGLAAITNMIKQGSNGGAWNVTGGITSSSAAAAYISHGNTEYAALGVALGSQLVNDPGQTWQGEALSANTVVVMYTTVGDATMDGTVTLDDYLQIDRGYLEHLSGWANGDFNYDGSVSYLDYALIDSAYAAQGGPQASAEIALHSAEFGASYVAALGSLENGLPPGLSLGATAVPEPASLAMLALGTGMLLRRGRGMRSGR